MFANNKSKNNIEFHQSSSLFVSFIILFVKLCGGSEFWIRKEETALLCAGTTMVSVGMAFHSFVHSFSGSAPIIFTVAETFGQCHITLNSCKYSKCAFNKVAKSFCGREYWLNINRAVSRHLGLHDQCAKIDWRTLS